MTLAIRGFGLAASLALVSTIASLPKARAQSTSPTAAYVYIQIQGPEGAVYGFRASSTGQLTATPGFPFKPAGLMIGSTATRFFTLGKDLIHSYGVASDGAIQSQSGQIALLDYAGSRCGGGTSGTDGAVLDHSGKYIYALLENGGDGGCAAYQSYIINSDGSFTFDGDTEVSVESGGSVDLPSILGSEAFAYADSFTGSIPGVGQESSVIGFRRESSGTLEQMQFHETDPAPGGNYRTLRPDASPTGNFLVLQLYPGNSNPPQLASYTVDPQGNISTANTSTNMPTTLLENPSSTFSPSGNLFVIFADNGLSEFVGTGNGLEIYSFNGAAPLTLYKTLLGSTPIDGVAWDTSNHLYAFSSAENMLYVFTVTPTSVTEDSALSIGSPYKMIVVSR
jgi:hypothetical protein